LFVKTVADKWAAGMGTDYLWTSGGLKVSIIENGTWKVSMGYNCSAVGTGKQDLCTKW